MFPSTSDPPEYDKYRSESAPTYTCLRRQSTDSFFQPTRKAPAYEDLENCVDIASPRRSRRSLPNFLAALGRLRRPSAATMQVTGRASMTSLGAMHDTIPELEVCGCEVRVC